MRSSEDESLREAVFPFTQGEHTRVQEFSTWVLDTASSKGTTVNDRSEVGDAHYGLGEDVGCSGMNTGFGINLDLHTGLIQFNIKYFMEC